MEQAKKEQLLKQLEEQTLERRLREEGAPPVNRSQFCREEDSRWRLSSDFYFGAGKFGITILKHSDLQAGKPAILHSHDFFEFNFVCRGECHNLVNGKSFTCGTDSLLLMNPNAEHSCQVEDTASQVVNLLISREMTDRLFLNTLSASDPISRFFLDSIYGQKKMKDYILFHSDERIMEVFWHMAEEFLTRSAYYQQILFSDLLRLFAELLRINPPAAFQQDLPEDSKLSAMLGYLRQHCADCSLQELAEVFHYSPSYTSLLIRKHCGKSFSQLQTEYRLSNACNFLRNSTISADAIAELIGYCDGSYFYKQFKKAYGVSPSEYRRQAR